MDKSWRNIALGLAGMAQAASLVEQLAKTGYLKSEQFETAMKSLLVQSATDAEQVFGSVSTLSDGLNTLELLLKQHRDPKNADLLRYILGILHLQKRLARRSDVLYIIGARLEKVEKQVEMFGLSHDNVVSNVADIYTDTISKFQYRIQVNGEYNYLQQARVAAQIRSLLLAGIRAATLWRQAGGSRWHLIFYRSRIEQAVSDLLGESKALN
ncbi:high frequency lysogenization protein HflD [Teredinibacter waterburyi]|uniref:high frequency lysogenization protein HflD n=1 Tax=Teredinibacter waterburyi TaxID=1500538 RepID=UPI00165EC046|nr:high frequency lysogenization protein HflD [Teredinibacter waterburyi]